MPLKLSASLTFLFTERPFLERFAAAAEAGFRGVECVAPYEAAADEIAGELERHGLDMVLFNTPAGDWSAGERGFAADPSRVDEFRRSLEQAAAYARRLGCRRLHLMAGKIAPDAPRATWRETLIANVAWAADQLAGEGIEILLEPLNSRVDAPGYFYDTAAGVMDVLRATGRGNVKLLYDVYHRQVMEGDLLRGLDALLPSIGHIQIADNPGRHEPGTGEVNFAAVLARIEALDYDGWVGCEYAPSAGTGASLAWARRFLAS